jgi:DNA-binding NarL/FixJ family response regulator
MRRCLICDDHELVRGALAVAIGGRWPDAEIVEVASFPQAWAAAAAGYDLILADLVMPGVTGTQGIARLHALAPATPLMVITGTHDDRALLDLLALGVAGFIGKNESTAVILAALELVLAGGRYLPPRVAELAAGGHPEPGTAPSPVSARQREVLQLIAGGQSNKQIALALRVSPATVKTHVASAIAAIGAQNRTDAAVMARSRGWI